MSSYYPPKMIASPAPAAGGADLRCRKCHSILAGLKSNEKCPKCGLSVAVSMQGAEIRYSDPAWVGRLRLGASFVLWGTIAILMAFALAAANEFNRIMEVHIPAMIAAVACLVYALGNWFLSAPDPSGLGEKTYGKARKISRIAWVLGALGINALIGGAVARPSLAGRWEFHLAIELCHALSVVAGVATLSYLSKLAVRMRDSIISERAKMLSKGFAIVGTVLIVINLIRDFVLGTQWAIDNDLAGLMVSFQALALLTGLVIWIVWILVLLRVGTRLKEQAKLARTTWALGSG